VVVADFDLPAINLRTKHSFEQPYRLVDQQSVLRLRILQFCPGGTGEMTMNPLPLEFRAEIIQQIVNQIESVESCSIVGVGSSGKSNVAHHLVRKDVCAKYFGTNATRIFMLYINCTPYAHRPIPEFYLYILDQLGHIIDELNDAFTPLRAQVSTLWRDAQANLAQLAKHNLDEALTAVVQAGAERIVLILDDCDKLIADASPVLFSDLRELRDNHKTCMVYVTLTRRELAFLRTETPEFEEFFELFSPAGHTFSLLPYNETDGFEMLRRLAVKQHPPRQLSPFDLQRLYELAGGHAGLLRSIFFAYHLRSIDLLALDIVERLAADVDVEEECGKIWASLETDEQADLRQLVGGGIPAKHGLRRLEWRGLIKQRIARPPEFFSPVFERFPAQLIGQTTAGRITIEFTGTGSQIRINGQLYTGLIPPEYEILRRLYQQRPRTWSRIELIEAMRMGEQVQSSKPQREPLARLEQYINHLKAKIGIAGQFIQRDGDGYRFGE
jgi:hypothetical protein